MAKSSFEDHMKIVEGSQTKTASASKVTPSLLDKLAAEMTSGASVVDAPAVTAIPAATTVVEAAPAVVAATEAIAVPQTNIAGGNEAEKIKGESTPASKPAAIVISAGDGKATDSQNFSKEPAAVAEAVKEAEEIGRTMARSYVAEMQKISSENQYIQAVDILKEAGLLDNYKLTEEIEKKAESTESALTKIANKLPLTKEDMVKAAEEYVELEKQAEAADQYGREQAHVYFDKLVKEAAEEVEDGADEEEGKKKKEKEAEKTSSDKAVEKAVAKLVEAGIIEG